jgi:hypothetical protein
MMAIAVHNIGQEWYVESGSNAIKTDPHRNRVSTDAGIGSGRAAFASSGLYVVSNTRTLPFSRSSFVTVRPIKRSN